jgi:hypothetical protein
MKARHTGKGGPHGSRKAGGRFVPPTFIEGTPPHSDPHATPHASPLHSTPKIEVVQTTGEFQGGTNDPSWNNLHPSGHGAPKEVHNKMIK